MVKDTQIVSEMPYAR